MRRVPHNTLLHSVGQYNRPTHTHLHSFLRVYYCSTPNSQKEQQASTKSNLWTFLWGSKEKKESNSRPAPIQDILSHKVKASEVSPFEYVFVNSVDKLEAVTSHLKQHKLLSVDCEGVDHSREGTLCLLQIATEKDIL